MGKRHNSGPAASLPPSSYGRAPPEEGSGLPSPGTLSGVLPLDSLQGRTAWQDEHGEASGGTRLAGTSRSGQCFPDQWPHGPPVPWGRSACPSSDPGQPLPPGRPALSGLVSGVLGPTLSPHANIPCRRWRGSLLDVVRGCPCERVLVGAEGVAFPSWEFNTKDEGKQPRNNDRQPLGVSAFRPHWEVRCPTTEPSRVLPLALPEGFRGGTWLYREQPGVPRLGPALCPPLPLTQPSFCRGFFCSRPHRQYQVLRKFSPLSKVQNVVRIAGILFMN